jgi:hypothetical protein
VRVHPRAANPYENTPWNQGDLAEAAFSVNRASRQADLYMQNFGRTNSRNGTCLIDGNIASPSPYRTRGTGYYISTNGPSRYHTDIAISPQHRHRNHTSESHPEQFHSRSHSHQSIHPIHLNPNTCPSNPPPSKFKQTSHCLD